jgi:hypothetical protein
MQLEECGLPDTHRAALVGDFWQFKRVLIQVAKSIFP